MRPAPRERRARAAVPSRPALALDTAAAWVGAAGTPQLARRLLLGIQPHVPVSFCFVFAMPPRGPARLVTGASLHGRAAMRAAEAYFEHGYERFDVNTRRLGARRVARRGDAILTLQTVERIEDADYRRACYEEPGVHPRAAGSTRCSSAAPTAGSASGARSSCSGCCATDPGQNSVRQPTELVDTTTPCPSRPTTR